MFKLPFNKYIFINLLFKKRAYADGPPPLQWVLTLDSFMHDALIFVLCSAVDFSKINTPGSKNSIDNVFFT